MSRMASVVLILCQTATVVVADDVRATTNPADIRAIRLLVEHLGAPQFRDREQATRRLKVLGLRQTGLTDSDLAPVTALTELVTLQLSNNPVTDQAFVAIGSLERLTLLHALGTKITLAGSLAAVTRSPALVITCPDGQVSENMITLDRAVDPTVTNLIGRFHNLKTLELSDTPVSKTHMLPLLRLKNLQQLGLHSSKLDGLGFSDLQVFTGLTELDLAGTLFDDTHLPRLTGLSQLDTLVLDDTRVTNAGLQHLSALEQLTTLSLAGTRISDLGFKVLARCRSLQSIDVSRTQVTNKGLATLASLTRLKGLAAENTRISNTGLRQVCSLPALEVLWISNTMVTDAGLPALANANRLRELDLSGCRITDNGLEHIAKSPNLKLLVLDDTQVTTKGILMLQSALPRCDIQYRVSSTNRKSSR